MSLNEPKKTSGGGFKLFRIFKHPSILVFIISSIVLGCSYGYSVLASEDAFTAAVPLPALEVWQTDLNGYHSRNDSYPPTLRELEKQIWIPARAGTPDAAESRLQHGPRMFLFKNYAYLYQRDGDDASICSVWAVPQGERYKEGKTYYWLLTPKSVTEWRGPALTVEQMRSIPTAARPTGEEMAHLGMSKQSAVTRTRKRRGLFSWLPF